MTEPTRHKGAKRRARAFTLIELMVSLIAGLFVAMAVVALSGAATNTFHEEARTASAEMSLRTAVERLRADLQRSGFMSTGNIQKDPLVAHAPGQPIPVTGPLGGLYQLAAIQLIAQGSTAATPLSAAAGLSPDAILLSGNFTTTDEYVVRYMDNGSSACTGGQRLNLATDSPAMWRVLSSPNPDATLEQAFQPVAGAQFLVRVSDNTGHYQYVPTCGGKAAGVSGSGLAASAWVDLDGSSVTVLTAEQTKTVGGSSGLGVGTLRVNPVQTVRWEIRPIDTTKAGDGLYAALTEGDAGSSSKYELFRTYVDATGAVVPQPELVAEYAVDLKFAFSADLTATGLQQRQLTVYGFSDAGNATVAGNVTNVSGTQAPQRLRSVRFRLATRSSTADRAEALDIPAANGQLTAFPARYCVLTACTAGQVGWARVRAVTTEVSLPNLASYFY